MNNKIFTPTRDMNVALLDDLRIKLERPEFFDRYGDARLSELYRYFGFSTVVPDRTKSKFQCFLRMLGCSFIYMPCGWQADKCSRKAFAWAELLGKKVIFEEDGRCR